MEKLTCNLVDSVLAPSLVLSLSGNFLVRTRAPYYLAVHLAVNGEFFEYRDLKFKQLYALYGFLQKRKTTLKLH